MECIAAMVDCPTLVVPPGPRDVQILRRKSLVLEAATLHEIDRGCVVRLDVRFEPMQAEIRRMRTAPRPSVRWSCSPGLHTAGPRSSRAMR